MTRSPRATLLAALFATLLAFACDDDPAGPSPGDQKPEGELTFVRFDPTSFGDVPLQASFWAVRGDDRRLEMRSNGTQDDEDGERFLELRIDDETLLRRPDGTPFAEGDSILITVTVDPGGRFLFDFQPSGLVFNPDEPAELKIRYVLGDDDFDHDGDVDEDDEAFEALLAIWQREAASDPFVRLQTFEVDAEELKADLLGFTGFALAN
ncbi:MAG: hypothetical protein KDA28_10195 [Phycisphaerales bacterium]|nr:hypothetical protein [Phycisphaerales bacterium]